MAFIQVEVGKDINTIAGEIGRHFPNLTAIRSGEFMGQIRLFKTVDFFAWVVSIISLVTCCIIIMNTFVMTVSERTKEIGILMAVGWSRGMIMRTIIAESLWICVFGGLLGNGIAVLELWLFYLYNPGVLGWLFPLSLSKLLFMESVGLSLLLGVSGSLYPAFRASRMLPSEALRCE
jgi:putative ABC transport system permease protein